MSYQKKRSFVFICLLILMTLLNSSCTTYDNNNKESEQLYSIETLKTFFEANDKLSFDESCLSFPVYTLRTIQDDEKTYKTAYTVYNVVEGGKYYVFWYTEDETNCVLRSQSYYIKYLPSAEKLATLNHQSTIDDVLQIDPSAYIVFCSMYTASFSLANDGNVYFVKYDKGTDNVNYVSSIDVCKSNECDLCYILREDYP